MRRLGQLVFTIAAVASAVFCVATAALWIASYWTTPALQAVRTRAMPPGQAQHCFLTLLAGRGGLQAQYGVEIWSVMKPPSSTAWKLQRPQLGLPRYPNPWFSSASPRLGFYFNWFQNPATIDRELVVPCWFVVVSAMMLPALWLRAALQHRLRRRRQLDGLCVRCRYNLAGNVSRVCPECGEKRLAA